MKKYLILLIILLITLVSCEFDPPQPKHTRIEVEGRNMNVYWQMIKDGEPDTGEYKPYPVNDYSIYDVEPGSGYTLRFYRAVNTNIENEGETLIEKRIIDSTYETHFVIDHYVTTITVTYTKEDGLGCKIEQSWPLS